MRHTFKMRSDLVARLARFVMGGLCEVWIFDVLAPFSVQCGLACQAEMMEAAAATFRHPFHSLQPAFDYQEGWSSSEAVSVAADAVAEEPGADAVMVDVAFDDDEPQEPEPNPSEPPEPEEPLGEPEGPDAEDEHPFHQKAIELIPGVWLGTDSAVDTTEPAGEPSQEVGGGQTDP